MIRYGNRIRLSEKEKRFLTLLTGETPHVKTVEALNCFIDLHLGRYPGRFPEERLLRCLLESMKIK